jgi:hypothetical protein
MKVSASKAATAPSAKPLASIKKKENRILANWQNQ